MSSDHYAMGVRFLRRSLPVIGPGVRFGWESIFGVTGQPSRSRSRDEEQQIERENESDSTVVLSM